MDTPESIYVRGDDSSARARQRFLSRAGTERSDNTMLDTSSNKPRHGAFMSGSPQKWATFRNDFVLLVISLYFAKELGCMNAVASSPCRRSAGAWVFYWIWRREARRGQSLCPPTKHTRTRSSRPAKGGRSSRACWPVFMCLYLT